MKKISIVLGFVFAFSVLGFQVYAEEWNDEQKEVWNNIQVGWENIKRNDAEALMAGIHPNAVIWWSTTTSPHRAELLQHTYEKWFSWDKSVSSELQPLRIEIYDNVAIIAYYVTWKGDKGSAKDKVLSFYKKQGDKWLQIGSLSSRCGEVPACLK
jgi:hypothetical protein